MKNLFILLIMVIFMFLSCSMPIQKKISIDNNYYSEVITLDGIKKVEVFPAPYGESTPFVFQNILYYMTTCRNLNGEIYYIDIRNIDHSIVYSGFNDYSLGNIIVVDNVIYLYATKTTGSQNSIFVFASNDLTTWSAPIQCIENTEGKIFNSSVCYNDVEKKFIMAYETEAPLVFSAWFAVSNDGFNWIKIHKYMNWGYYAACPTIRFIDGYYYVFFLAYQNRAYYNTHIARTIDFNSFEFSKYVVLQPDSAEGINASDMDLTEFEGQTKILYLTGDQKSWAYLQYSNYDGTLKEFCERYF